MSALENTSRIIDVLNERIGKAASWAIVVAILVSCINAIIRKLFGISSNGWLELQWYLFGIVFMFGTAWTLKCNEHIRIDVFSAKLSKKNRDLLDVFGHVFFLLPFCAIMIAISWPFFFTSFSSQETSTNAGGLYIWPAKGMILLGFMLLGLQGISELIKRILIMQGKLEDKSGSGGHQAAAEAEAERLLELAVEAEAKSKLMKS